MNPETRTVGIVAPGGSLTLRRWREVTVAKFAEINPEFIYFFVESESKR